MLKRLEKFKKRIWILTNSDSISRQIRKPSPKGDTQHICIRGGVSPRNFQATQKYHSSFIATQKNQLILYLETCI